jgi:hypothetical protein
MRGLHILTALGMTIVPLVLAAQAPADLPQAIKLRDQAIDKADTATWERLTAPNFTGVDATGHRFTRAERLVELKQQKPAASASSCGQERVTLFANGMAATRTCLADGVWWLDVWMKSSLGWQVVAVQGTPTTK